jgi:ketosteroid isomerase-like protein
VTAAVQPAASSVAVAAASTPAAAAAPPAAVVAAAPRAASAAEASAPAARPNEEATAVTAAVRDWAAAWSRKDVAAYVAAYATGFKGSESSASEWQATRRERILGKRKISVDVSDLKIDVRNDVAKATFRQAYVADQLRVTSQKSLELERHTGKWLIRKESTGS